MPDSTHALTGVALADPKRTVDSALEGPGFEPEVREATPDDLERTGGWGFLLIDRLSDDWGVGNEGALTRAWFELNLSG